MVGIFEAGSILGMSLNQAKAFDHLTLAKRGPVACDSSDGPTTFGNVSRLRMNAT